MKIAVNLSEHIYVAIKNGEYCGILDDELYQSIKNGVVLTDDHDENEDEMGYWIIERDPNTGKDMSYHCSLCYEDSGFATTSTSKFCPNCGKRMHRQPIEENMRC